MDQTITETEYAKLSHTEHSEIINAIQSKDAEKARKLMRDHIKRSCDNILMRFDKSKE